MIIRSRSISVKTVSFLKVHPALVWKAVNVYKAYLHWIFNGFRTPNPVKLILSLIMVRSV